MKWLDIIGEEVDYHIRVVPDDSDELKASDAAIYRRQTKEIIVRQRYAVNTHIMNHEIGHAVFDHVQSIQWVDAFQHDADAWADFLTTSTARSYQGRHGHRSEAERHDPRQYDWVEAAADLWMEYRAGRFAQLDALVALLDRMRRLAD